MGTKLARDDRQSVLQVSSYKTETYQNIDGLIASASTDAFEYDTIARVKSYGGDNWVKRETTLSYKNQAGSTVTVGGAGTTEFNTTFTWNSTGLFLSGGTLQLYFSGGDGAWALFDSVSNKAYYAIGTIASIPTTGWVVDTLGYFGDPADAPVPTSFTFTSVVEDAVLEEGMLMEAGEELTMFIYAGEAISTIGGVLNIVPVAI